MIANNHWYCVVISSTAYYGKTDLVIEELKSVLFPSAAEILVVNDPEIMKTGEYFVFVSSKNFLKKKEDICKLSCVIRIQSSGDSPYRFSDKEVSGFVKSIEKKDEVASFKRGDVVVVKNGYLKNLFGIVSHNTKGKVRVMFRFHVRDFYEEFEPKDLKYDKSIFDSMPSNVDRSEWYKKFVGHDKTKKLPE